MSFFKIFFRACGLSYASGSRKKKEFNHFSIDHAGIFVCNSFRAVPGHFQGMKVFKVIFPKFSGSNDFFPVLPFLSFFQTLTFMLQ